MRAWTFQLPQGNGKKRVDVQSITVREVNGRDEEIAAAATEAKGKHGSMVLELLRLAIVKIDGAPTAQPFGEIDKWNARTRKLALDAYISINGTTKEESEAFLASAEEEDVGAPIVALSSVNG